MKKWKANWKKILIVLILILLLVFGILMYGKVSELTNQLAYLQDTTNIILSDVGGMQSSIEKTLEEEASMVEDYSIEVKDMDFARHEYKVEVSVIPKEYTDNTTMSIYFGTTECPVTCSKEISHFRLTKHSTEMSRSFLQTEKRRQRKWWKTLMVSAENLIRFYREL